MSSNNEQASALNEAKIAVGAAITGVINDAINGAIQWYLLANDGPLPLTVDCISNDEHTVFGAAVPLAVSLAIILTAVAYTTVKPPKPPFYPVFRWMTVKHGFFALGVIVTFAVLWQRIFGSILVSLPVGVVLLGLLAGMVAATVNFMTIRASMSRGA